jgi:hypothetical protein
LFAFEINLFVQTISAFFFENCCVFEEVVLIILRNVLV